ncbi:MAG: cation-translocating P-type ATPase [Bacilli bacterium]|nr:cation-translocating P-type ATPase [Bacilli bacterium]
MVKKELLKMYEVDPLYGLKSDAVLKNRELYGYNELSSRKKKSLIIKFLEQFKDILIIILILAAVLSFLINPDDLIESIIIFLVVIINASLGVYQEAKAEKSLEALKKLSTPLTKALRDGNITTIESKLLVPGDIILVEAGDFIPADCHILEVSNLKVDESSLTGESVPVEKISDDIEVEAALGDRKNELFSSTYATYGRAKAIVTKTGMETEIGKIAKLLADQGEEKTPLQLKLDQIGKVIGMLAIIICVIVFLIEWLAIYPDDPLLAFKSSIALAVAAIPEGLSTVVVVVLAMGVEQMVRHNAIVKRLPAVETLGATQIVCSDKTGTLTQNKMTVLKLYKEKIKNVDSTLTEEEKEMLSLFSLCTDASITIVDGKEVRIGDPTETALIAANNEYGLYPKEKLNFERVVDLPFDSSRKMMSVIVKYKGKLISITKGAVDVILDRSQNVDKEKILEVNNQFASNALRVLGIGYKVLTEVPDKLSSDVLEVDLEFIGLVGMIDPARSEVKESIKLAKEAGIRTIMITGDHIVTAKAIATELGILNEGEIAISSAELNKLTDEELYEKIEEISVYARVAPIDKVRIVSAWQKKGKVVAMTGDGVNDAPALKKADIGCAMGITGTDVSKEAASMILVDDNFATIITAVKHGRGIYANIKKTVQYLLSSNIGEVITIFLATLIAAFLSTNTNFGIPLLPIHLLWINLITDTLPAFGLGLEDAEDDVMQHKPRDKNESFFAHGLGRTIIIQGIIIGFITLAAYIIGIYTTNDQATARTMAFLTLSMIQLFHSFNLKSEHTIFSKQIFNNKFLIGSFLVGVFLQFSIVYVPNLANIFKVKALNLNQLLVCLGLAALILVIVETYKLIKKKIDN